MKQKSEIETKAVHSTWHSGTDGKISLHTRRASKSAPKVNQANGYIELPEPDETLFRIQRGLAGYVSYLAACETNTTFTEYSLYEPIARILMTRGYAVRCESPCEELSKGRGDHKRIDFEASKGDVHFAIEVKWPRKKEPTIRVKGDYEKLITFRKKYPNSYSFLCVVGRHSHIDEVPPIPDRFSDRLAPLYAFFGRTQFGCRILQLDIG